MKARKAAFGHVALIGRECEELWWIDERKVCTSLSVVAEYPTTGLLHGEATTRKEGPGMTQPYIPAEDSAALDWMQVFSDGITANPGLYQLSAADATAISGAVSAFDTAYQDVIDPATKTSVTVATKDDARVSAEQICRQYAILIKSNAGISDPDKIAIGVRPVNSSREPINVPESSPLLNVIAATPGSQTLRYADTFTPDSAAKPFGAVSLQLFIAIDDVAVTDETAGVFYGNFTRNPVAVGFGSADDGKMATYFARWQSRKGDVGPWSLPVSMRIAA